MVCSPKHFDFVWFLKVFAGDFVVVQPSAIYVMRHWPEMRHELDRDKVDASTYYFKHNGDVIYGPDDPTFNDPQHTAERPADFPFVGPLQIRKKFYTMLLRQVARVGLKVDYGMRVESYFEDSEAGLGGVVIADGSTRTAHIVAAGDAAKSRSELLVAGEHMPTRPSGMSIYRCVYPRELTKEDETIRERWADDVTRKDYFIGPGMHINIFVSPEFMGIGVSPRDDFLLKGNETPIESWDPNVDPEEVLKTVQRVPHVDPVIHAVLRRTPKGSVIHWPLLWRNLYHEWTSKCGHVVQLGDAAHATLPASVSGATLALEDAVTLAACLQLSSYGGGPAGAPLGAKVYNLLRYQRVSCTQKMAFVNSQLLNARTTNWDAIKKDPKRVRLRFPTWVFRHDPEAYAYEKYGQAFAHLVNGTEFVNTNFPPGHKFVPWTIEQIEDDVKNGKRVEDFLDGDWL